MNRLLIALMVCITWAGATFGQTTVNLSVTDTPDNQTWNNGTWSVQLIPGPGNPDQTRSFTLLVAGGSLGSQSGSLSSTGTASMSLPANVNIGPVGTKWQFTVCSQQGTACSISNVTVVTTSPQAVVLTPQSIRVASSPNLPPIVVYTTTEISSASIGSQITVVGSTPSTPSLQSCTAVSGSTCTTWASAGNPTVSLPGPVFNVKDPKYGAIGDAKHSNACQFNASTTLTCTDSPFASGDVGKLIFCIYGPTPTNETAAGTKITAFTSATTVTISNAQFNGGAVVGNCTWATQDDTAAFQAAFTAASAGTGQGNPNFSSPTTAYPGVIYVPPGGYMVSGNIYDFNGAFGNTISPSFKGAGSTSTIIYPRSDTFTAGARACLMDNAQGGNFTWSGFLIMGGGWGFNCGASTIPFMRLNVSTFFTLQDIFFSGVGVTNGGSPAVLNFFSVQNGYVNQVNAQGTSSNNAGGAIFELDGSSATLIEQSFFSNNTLGPNMIFSSTGVRNASGQQVSMISGGSDECGGGGNFCVDVINGSFVNFIGATIFGEPSGAGHGALTIDGTSGVYLTSMNVGPFLTSQNSNGIAIAAGGFVYATGSHIRGGGTTGSLIDGPSTATFVDDGGNVYQRCLNSTCTNITAATFSGAFTSGIVPKSSLTHTPNTCYAVTGNLLATAQNICTILLDQNYQVLNITAQSGGTTPANSSCTGAPVITMSDGTRTATLTMTTGKTAWSSSVDVATVNTAFASGATLTVSIGANTCVTPPTNVSVNYVLQSVLNQ